MTRFSTVAMLPGALLLAGLAGCSDPPPEAGADYWAGPTGTWQEVYRDDFDGPSGTAANASSWNENVNGAPFNHELEYYTNRPDNLMLDGAGDLVITARSEYFVDPSGVTSTQPYTSGRLDTLGHVEPQYGRIEARIKLPAGKGLWPAFWLLGKNFGSVGWPACGEIDILEMRGSAPNAITGSLHGPGYADTTPFSGDFTLPSGTFADAFHVFALEWTAEGMRWLVDEQPFGSRTPQGLTNQYSTWIFDQPMYIILNLAVGGIYDGDPSASTPMPAQMLVDYVKVSTLVPAPSNTQ
jgi:beta-glucanase (GH16 family)